MGELARMYARLGRVEQTKALLNLVKSGEIEGKAESRLRGAKEALWHMENDPDRSFQCGPHALYEIQKSLGKDLPDKILNLKSIKEGTNLAQLQEKANEVGLSLSMVKRIGSAPLPLPALIHWKVGHFAAALSDDNGKILISDPTFGEQLLVSRGAIDQESSGYYLVPTNLINSSFRRITPSEAATVWGKGLTTSSDEDETRDDSGAAGGGCGDGKCCGAGGTPGGGGDGDDGSGPFPGMAQYKIHLMLVSLSIFDTPLRYSPPVGPKIAFKVTYNSKEASQPSIFDYTNFGSKWNFSYLAYVKDDPTLTNGPVSIVRSNGGSERYIWSTTFSRYTQDLRSRAQLTKVSSSPIIYEKELPDGSKEIYSASDSGLTNRRVFLTQIIDPQGNALTLSYDFPSAGGMRLVTITDAIGQISTISYQHSTDIYKVTKIRDPFGRFATFTYDTSTPPNLYSITDVIGITSQFPAPPTPGESFTMVTPYGTTNFTYSDALSIAPDAWLEAKDPLNQVERVEFRQNAPGIASSESPVPLNVTNNYLQFRNTFYWNKNAYALHGADYSKAKIFHWLHVENTQKTAGFLESTKEPLERRIWHRWQSQSDPVRMPADSAGISRSYRVLDDGTTQNVTYRDMNGLGNILLERDPRGREKQYTYDSNRIDLLTVKEMNENGALKTVLQYSNYINHRPEIVTDVSGRTITYTYNSRGQMTSETNQKGETKTFSYDLNGYLTTITGPDSVVQYTFTYDSYGRQQTSTDVLGHTLTYEYDDADRVTKVTYPDSSFELNSYDKLDIKTVRNRDGKVTTYERNALRQLIKIIEPNGQMTQFDWCACGAMTSITDPLGHVTSWDYDIQSRPVKKTYHDGKFYIYTYEPSSSRLMSVLDPMGQTTNISWHLDDRLKSLDFVNAVVPTDDINFSYNIFVPRLQQITDTTGTTAINYNPIDGSTALGQGRMLNINGPLANDTISYTYDELGRVLSEKVDGTGETYSYDALDRLQSKVNPLGTFSLTYDGSSDNVLSNSVAILGAATLEHSMAYYSALNDNRLKDLTSSLNSSQLTNYNYTYSPAGLIQSWSNAFTVNNGTSNILGSFVPTYDDNQRLLTSPVVAANNKIKLFSYSYDQADNIRSITEDSIVRSIGVNSVNQLTRVNNPSQRFSYDNNGNLNSVTSGNSYEYDALNRLTAVINGPQRSEFSYDGFNRIALIVEKLGGVVQSTKNVLWCGERICEERTGANRTRHYPEGYTNSSGTFYYIKDHLGSIRAILDGSGNYVGQYQYDPYGKISIVPGTGAAITLAFAYTGFYYHQPSGLNLAMYRAYDSVLGRWLNRDPIEEVGGLNLYSYVNNYPINFVDPTGLLRVKNESGKPIFYKPENESNVVRLCSPGEICDIDGIYPETTPQKIYDGCLGTPVLDRECRIRGWCLPFTQRPLSPPFFKKHKDWPNPYRRTNGWPYPIKNNF